MPPKATLTGVQVALMALQVVLSGATVLYLMTYVSGSRKVQERQECQIQVNTQLRERSAIIAAAQTTYNAIDEKFTIADEAWVDDQIRVLDATRANGASPAEREKYTAEWRRSLVAKKESATEKKEALRRLDEARSANPVPPPPDC